MDVLKRLEEEHLNKKLNSPDKRSPSQVESEPVNIDVMMEDYYNLQKQTS
jgi:hypothetical protein